MFKRLMILALAMLLVIPAVSTAKDMTGKWGLGFNNYSAPIGARFWVTPKVGLDVGIGFEMDDVDVYDDEAEEWTTESATDFYFEVGVPFVMVPTERVNFYLRPGIQVALYDSLNNEYVKNSIAITFAPGVEYFLTEDLSIEASHGIAYRMDSARREDADSRSAIFTFGENFAFLGFHFYLK